MFFININVAVSLWNRERNMDIPSSGVKKKNKYKKGKEIKEPKKIFGYDDAQLKNIFRWKKKMRGLVFQRIWRIFFSLV